MKPFCPTKILCVALAAAAGIFAGCSKKAPSDVLARVGDKAITVADFKAECARRQANRLPLPDRQTLLDQMIDRETSLQRAKAAGLDNAAEVRRACEDVLIAKYRETQLAPQLEAAKVSPEEIQAAYEKNLANFTEPAKVKLAFIRIAVNPRADTNQVAAAQERAANALRLAAALPPEARGFATVAADFSDDQATRYRGGDAGWFAADSITGRWPAAAVAAGFALTNAGDVSDVLKADNGFYLVKKLDARAAAVTPLERVSSVIEHRLLFAKRQEAERQFLAQARQAARVETDATLLATVDYPAANPKKTALASIPASPNSP